MTTKLSNGEEIELIEVPEDATHSKVERYDGGRTYLTWESSAWNNIEFVPDDSKILGTLESGIFKGDRMLSDEQRVALKSADPDKKYVVLITNHK